MERVTWVNHIRLCTRDLLNELLDTVEKETAGLKDDTSSRLKQATDRIRTKLEVIDEFDKYITACDDVHKFVDKALTPSRRERNPRHDMPAPVPPARERKGGYEPKYESAGSWPPPYWDGFNPEQFPCEFDSTYVKPCEWKPAVPGTETYNVMYSNKTDGGMQ